MENNLITTSIVITSIFNPTIAVRKFSQIKDKKLIIIGDKKTPSNWSLPNTNFISIDAQARLNFKLASILPYNHYCRKMLGYLIAMQDKVEYIIDTDDDNIPNKNWKFPEFDGSFDYLAENLGFVNIYQLFTKQKIWPRGLPLNLINKDLKLNNLCSHNNCTIGVWQGLADEDPDVDAIYRLTNDTPCYFNDRQPIVLGKGTISPFNSQNTIIRKELFSLLYLPAYVTFRFTDILRGLIAQPIMWLYGYQLGFTNATVIQKRNPHDYMKDFISEIPMYQYCERIIEIVQNSISKNCNIETNIFNTYTSLLKENIVTSHELLTLEAWLIDLENLKKTTSTE